MKLLHKQVFAVALFILALQLPGANAQGPSKNSTAISSVLNISLPDSSSESRNGFIKTYFGGDSLESYELTFFDTIVVKTSNESDFNIALKGFVAGKFAGAGFKSYDLWLTDTLIGNLQGLFISGTTADQEQEVKKFYCFVTIANSNSYWFFYYLRSPALPTSKAGSFFSAIQFNRNKIKEAAYKINALKKHKVVGKTWYLSPELDYPISLNERKESNQDNPSYPPKPPPPPIRKEWIVTASKLAADYKRNQSQADKQYKKGHQPLIVEGIVKEIKEKDDRGITIIILDGGPSTTDIQCEILNAYRIKNLKKGMKALFDAHCEGLNGNVILSRCIYLEKPTYE